MSSKNLAIYQLSYTPEFDLKNIPQNRDLLQINIANLNGFDLEIFKSKTKLPIIISCVRSQNGGLFEGQKQLLVEIYNEILKIAPDFVGIEASLTSLVDLTLKKAKTQLILVDTNLYKTPNYRGLRKIAKQMSVFKPYFYQFNYKLQAEKDSSNLLRFLLAKKKQHRFIIQTSGDNSDAFNQEVQRFGVAVNYL